MLPRHDLHSPASTPRALQILAPDFLSENLKLQNDVTAAGGAPTLKSTAGTPKTQRKWILWNRAQVPYLLNES